MNSAGMNEEDRQAYLERNLTGWRMTSGILPEGMQVAETVLGGTSHRQTGSPVAALGWGNNVVSALNQTGSALTGQGEAGQAVRSAVRSAPFGNTVMGAYLMNAAVADY